MTSAAAGIAVNALLRVRREALDLDIQVVAGATGLERLIRSPYVLKTGLALAGYEAYLKPGRVLVLGGSELGYLQSLVPDARVQALTRLFACEIPCILITDGRPAPDELLAVADGAAVPLLRTSHATPMAIAKLTGFLEDVLAERMLLHAVLMDILGLGVLLVGESGIGKSECALDLVLRGHRLVADDTVEIRRRAESVLIGACPELTRHHMEIRGLGVINVRDLFGIASTRRSKRVELVVQLERWEAGREYERLGLDDAFFELMGLQVPLIRMPVAPGRSLANLVEVAARNQLLRSRGHHAARDLAARLEETLRDGATPPAAEGDDPGEPENE